MLNYYAPTLGFQISLEVEQYSVEQLTDACEYYIEKAAEYVNSIEDNHELEGVATVLYLIQNNEEMDEEKVLKLFKDWSEDKAARFSKQQILDCWNYLVDTRILEKNLCGFYELNEYNH